MTDVPKSRPGIAAASPRTRALEVLIQASLDQLLDETPAKANEGLLFLGNWHDALPRLLIQDPILQPVDKVVWQVIKLQATAQGATGFPTYDQIARWANVASDATVARAISILRSTRWLTLCVQKARTRKGRFRGNVYALHDEPLALGDTLHLDPEYMQFLCRIAAKPGEGRVGEVAKAVLGSIEQDIQEGIDVTAPRDAMTERMEAMRFITAKPGQAGPAPTRVFGVRRGFAMTLQSRVKDPAAEEVTETGEDESNRNLDLFTPEVHLQNLKMDGNDHLQKMKVGNRLQNLKSVPQPQNLNPQNLGSAPSLSSSGSKNITTTTTYLDGLDNNSARAREAPFAGGDRVGPTQSQRPSITDCVPGTQFENATEIGRRAGCSAPKQPGQSGGDGCVQCTQQESIASAGEPESRGGGDTSCGSPGDGCVQCAQSSGEPPSDERARIPGNQLASASDSAAVAALYFPVELSQNEIVLAGLQLAKVPADLQQEVLDLLGDRIRAAAAGTMEPLIYGPLGYLRSLCQRAIAGTLVRRVRVVQAPARSGAAPVSTPPPPPDEDVLQLKKLRDDHFNALQWKQKLERIGPGRTPTAEQLGQHQARVEEAVRQMSRFSQQIQELLAQRPDLRPAATSGDISNQPPPAPGARQ